MQRILTVNAGSSSIKLGVFDVPSLEPIARTQVSSEEELLQWTQPYFDSLVAIGHRVVHGGTVFTKPTQMDDAAIQTLRTLIPLAPLHEPHNIHFIELLKSLHPDCAHIACFDTAFHHSVPDIEQRYAIPDALMQSGVKRYGFHGLSYEYIASVLPDISNTAAQGRTVVAHLGNGSSMCALLAGKSIATTMGFSTVDGLMMGTRSGSIDPGVLLYLERERNMGHAEISKLLHTQSGLLGVSGISSDMRTLEASASPEAERAISLYCYMAAKHLGSLAMVLGGLDALVFTGGIGEHSSLIRARICGYLAWMGLELYNARNIGHNQKISAETSVILTLVVPTNEEKVIAKACLELL